MKKILPLILVVLASKVSSQTFSLYKINNVGVNTETVTNGYNIQESTIALGSTQTKLKIKNNAASTTTYNVTRTIVSMSPNLILDGSTNTPNTYFCFGNNCFGSNVATAPPSDVTILLASGQTSSVFPMADNSKDNNQPFTIYVDEGTSAGMYKVRYKVFNVNNASTDTVAFTVSYNITSGLKSVAKAADFSYEIFPNPSNGDVTLNINSSSELASKLVVINNLGQVVKKMDVTLTTGTNNIKLNTSDLSEGIYNVVLSNSKGSVNKNLTVSK